MSKKDEEEKKPYEPRPAKYKENYEDKGLKVFKPDFVAIGTVTTDTYKRLGPNIPLGKKGRKSMAGTESEESQSVEGSAPKNGTASASAANTTASSNSTASVETF